MPEKQTFRQELKALINKHSRENASGTPDYLLADYLDQCLILFEQVVRHREVWHGRPDPCEGKHKLLNVRAFEFESDESTERANLNDWALGGRR